MNGRFRSEQGQNASQTHDNGVNQRRVRKALQRLDQDPQKLLHVAIGDDFADAAVDDQGPRLQSRIIAESKTFG